MTEERDILERMESMKSWDWCLFGDAKAEIRRLRAEVEHLRDLLGSPDCTCQMCGAKYREDVQLSDSLWNLIRPTGKPDGGGLLCGKCIGERLTAEVDRLKRNWAQAVSALSERAAEVERLTTKPSCELCGTFNNVVWDKDPYSAEIHNNHQPRWLCDNCRRESADDV